MSQPNRRHRSAAWGILLAVIACCSAIALAGCNVSNLAFTTDNRLHFTAPGSRALVHLPVRLAWDMSDFTLVTPGSVPPTPHAGYFAIFVDRVPIRAGQSLLTLADKSCRETPGCYNADYLAARGVYTTSDTSYTLAQIASVDSYQKVQLHEVTIVLLDSSGHRLGESAWYRDFRLRAPGV